MLEYAFGSGLDWPDERLGSGIAARHVRRGEGAVARRARVFGAADAAGARRLGRPAARVAGGVGSGVRRSGRDGAVARGEAAHVRQGGGGPPAALLLRRGRAAARPGADRRAAGAERALRPGAGRAVPHGRDCACTATGGTAWPGTATPSGAARTRTRWSPSCRWARRGRCCCARGRRGRAGRGGSLRFEVGHGDLLVMGGSCQRTWEHAVPKTSQAVGPRISVQFRPAGCAEASRSTAAILLYNKSQLLRYLVSTT